MNLTARIAATLNRSGAARDNVVGAAAMPAVFSEAKGSGAPSSRRLRLTLVTLALAIAAVTAVAAPASADTVKMGVNEVSYDTAHVTGNISVTGTFASYTFEYSTDGTNWSPGPGGFLQAGNNQLFSKDLEGLKGGTEYFVRLNETYFNAQFESQTEFSPEPNPSFTTLSVDPPLITATDNASAVFSTSATATGKVKRPANEDDAFDVTCRFEYVTENQFGATGFQGATTRPCAENPIGKADAGAERTVSAQLGCTSPVSEAPQGNCLEPSTTYHLRLSAENAAPGFVSKDAPATFTTAAKVAAPTVIATDAATEIGSNSAKLTGEVERPAGADPALNTSCHFEYVTDAQFLANEGSGEPAFTGAGSVDCAENQVTSTGETTVSADPELAPSTTYHFRLVAENGGGSDVLLAPNTFTTLIAEVPSLTLDPIPSGTYTTAHLSGLYEGSDRRVVVWIEVSTDSGASWSREGIEVTNPVEAIDNVRTELQPGTSYVFRLSGTYGSEFLSTEELQARGEIAFSPERSITTEPAIAPSVDLDPVSAITATTAHFSGTVDTNAPAGPLNQAAKDFFKTEWHIECTPACPGIGGTVSAEEGSKAVSADVVGLDPGTSYEVKLIASNALETAESVQAFDTDKSPPSVKQTPGSSDGSGGYTLEGVVNPNSETLTDCYFEWGPNSNDLVFHADCLPGPVPGARPTTVEAHLGDLTPDVDYYSRLVVKYGASLEVGSGSPQQFKATLATKEPCPANEGARKENNSLALPECRAYEQVTPPDKAGLGARIRDFADDGGTVQYQSEAGNIANSGSAPLNGINQYVSVRGEAGWETLANLNGPLGSIFAGPDGFQGLVSTPIMYSADFRSSIWGANRKSEPPVGGGDNQDIYLRNPDGTFTRVGKAPLSTSAPVSTNLRGASGDLSHVVVDGTSSQFDTVWGPGVYEFVGIGNDQPRRVDLDNTGNAITTCGENFGVHSRRSAFNNAVSIDGSRLVFTVAGGCGAPNPPAKEVWARIDATTSIDISASHCTRPDCNAPADATFEGATPDGSRVFFTTTQQLLNGDTDQTYDLYACELPAGTPAPIGPANSCASLIEVSGSGAEAELAPPTYNAGRPLGSPGVLSISEDGSTAYFIAKGVLADNQDAFGEEAVAGDENLYVWRSDAADPGGQTTFAARLDSNDLRGAQSTPDGSDLVFTTANSLVPTDTDTARDVYRYDADAAAMDRVSLATSGAGGNADAFDARIADPLLAAPGASSFIPEPIAGHQSHPAVSNDGSWVAFTTAEPLSPLDGNGAPDAYLWKDGHVFLISTGSVGGGASAAYIDGSGRDVFFETPQQLIPSDRDQASDVYDARIDGGFSVAETRTCEGESCRPPAPPLPPREAPGSQQPGAGNPPQPKPCPKGKVRRHGRCVKKHGAKKHHAKRPHKKTGHGRGGSK